MVIKLNLTEEHLRLIPIILLKDNTVKVVDGHEGYEVTSYKAVEGKDDEVYAINKEKEMLHSSVRIDKDNMYCLGSHLLEDISLALGLRDQAIKETLESPDGLAFPDDVEKHMLEVHNYIVDNLYYIETLIHQFVIKGGITPGTYKAKDNDLIWEREN